MISVLVVEDDAVIVEDIRRTLIRLGYTVPRTAQSGEEALQAAAELRPNLVLMDIKLKGKLDGIETTALLRKQQDVPVVFLTSHSDEATLARAKETGPHGYLLKPFNDRDLRTTIEVAVRKHELELKLAERERWFSTTLESIGDAVIATDPSERVTFMNPVAEALTGWTKEEARGKKVEEVFRLIDENGKHKGAPGGRAVLDRFRVQLPPNARLVAKAGASLDVDESSGAIVDERGRVLGGVVVFRDITERRKLEQRLARSERLAAIGTLAAGTAHEINNPLAAVLANVTFALERMDEVQRTLESVPGATPVLRSIEDARDALKDADRAGERVRRIVHDLKKFSRADHAEREVLDLPDVIDAAIQLTQNQIRHNATLSRQYGTTPLVEANEGRLVQVFTNLLVNAAQAIGEGRSSENQITVATYTDDAGRAITEVRDTGPGIPAADLPRVFEPFFTTKPVGTGTGLGLSICHGIVTSLGGEISVESRLGRGATFKVALLPATSPADKRVLLPPVLRPPRRGKVLVIDDEEAVCRTVARVLREHDVVSETDARAALSRIAHGDRYDVIFCDLLMPNLTGIEVYRAIHSAHAELAERIVFLTGGVFSQAAAEFLGSVGNITVSKPFTAANLNSIVTDFVKATAPGR
ncbi:MAG: response regulator [Myxococcota bacterium]